MIRAGKSRYGALLLLAVLSLLLVEAQLFKLQWVENDFWMREVEKNRTRAKTLPFKRGWILDCNRTPLAVTQSLFELRFVFRTYRLNSTVGQIGMVFYLLEDVRPSLESIYTNPEAHLDRLLCLKPSDIRSQPDRWKQKDLITYVKWIFQLSSEEGSDLFESDALQDLPFKQIRMVADRLEQVRERMQQEREALQTLERLVEIEDGAFLSWPDKAAQRADRVVKSRLEKEIEDLGGSSYLKQRKQHREVDSYETTVFRNLQHDAAVRVTVGRELYPGFYIVESAKRCYPAGFTDLSPLLIGTCGLPNQNELEPLLEHRDRLEALSLIEEKTEDEMIEEENLRLKIHELDTLPEEEVGRLGLEAMLEPVLRGKRGFIYEELGSRSDGPKVLEHVAPIHGQDVMLTLDAPFQRACERALDGTGYPGAVVFMNVHTGAILAMATTPQPTRLSLSRNYSELLNNPGRPLLHRAVYNHNLPPPGSVFKLVTSIAALSESTCSTLDCFDCPRRIDVGRSAMHCEGLHGAIAMEEALIKSCNIYFYRVGELLGYETLFHWAELFGFGRRTGYLDRALYGIEGRFNGFPEASGALKKHEQGRANLMRLAIGQGAIDDVTPLQVARMVAGIATGKLPQPMLITQIGERKIPVPPAQELGIDPDHLNFVRQAMKQVVLTGTAAPDQLHRLDLVPFKVAGKTGTPQVGGGRPSHACFAGYFPWDAPQMSFAVFVESCGMHGGEAAAPVVNRILESQAALPYVEGSER